MKQATSRMLFATWDAARGERTAPDRADLEPERIRHLVADTFLLAVSPGMPATIRIAGTRCAALFGRDLAGDPFSVLWTAAETAEAGRLIDLVSIERSGVVAGVSGVTADGSLPLELLLLPLRQRGAPGGLVIGALTPDIAFSGMPHRPVLSLAMRSMRIIRSAVRHDPAPDLPAPKRPRFVVLEGGRTA